MAHQQRPGLLFLQQQVSNPGPVAGKLSPVLAEALLDRDGVSEDFRQTFVAAHPLYVEVKQRRCDRTLQLRLGQQLLDELVGAEVEAADEVRPEGGGACKAWKSLKADLWTNKGFLKF